MPFLEVNASGVLDTSAPSFLAVIVDLHLSANEKNNCTITPGVMGKFLKSRLMRSSPPP